MLYTIYSTCTECLGGDECCSSTNKCDQWDGDCDNDGECKDGLACGEDNCPRKYGHQWDPQDDCCFKLGTPAFSF